LEEGGVGDEAPSTIPPRTRAASQASWGVSGKPLPAKLNVDLAIPALVMRPDIAWNDDAPTESQRQSDGGERKRKLVHGGLLLKKTGLKRAVSLREFPRNLVHSIHENRLLSRCAVLFVGLGLI
jgi:hypothetical protein